MSSQKSPAGSGASPSRGTWFPWILSGLSAAVALGSLVIALSGYRAAAEEKSDLFAQLNEAFHAHYNQVKKQALQKVRLIVIAEGDELVLLHGGNRRVAQVAPPLYHTLKAVAHLPLGLYATLADLPQGRLTEDVAASLPRVQAALRAVRQHIKEGGFNDDQVQRQHKILDASEKLLDEVLKTKTAGADRLQAYVKDMTPLVLANAEEAARALLDGIHAALGKWQKTYPDAPWEDLRVVVMGSGPPRRDNLTVQYFARLLKQRGEGPRLLYTEAIFDEKRALAVLGARLVDDRASQAFFGDPDRLQRDLLGDAARKYVPRLLP